MQSDWGHGAGQFVAVHARVALEHAQFFELTGIHRITGRLLAAVTEVQPHNSKLSINRVFPNLAAPNTTIASAHGPVTGDKSCWRRRAM